MHISQRYVNTAIKHECYPTVDEKFSMLKCFNTSLSMAADAFRG